MSQNLPKVTAKVEKIHRAELPARWNIASLSALGVGSVALFWALFINPVWWVWLLAGGTGLYTGGSLMSRSIQRRQFLLASQSSQSSPSDFKKLKQSFDKMAFLENLNDLAKEIEKAKQHCFEIQTKKKNFYKLLGETFNPSEQTYGRYELAYLDLENALFDHLQEAEYTLSNLSTQTGELSEQRRDQQHKSKQRVLTLVDETEKALAVVNDLYVSLSQVKNEKDKGEIDLKQAMEQIEELAQRAKVYSTKN